MEKAVEYATKVIDSKKYILADATKHSYSVTYNDFAYMWQYDNSTEIIWKVMFEVNSYGGALGTVFSIMIIHLINRIMYQLNGHWIPMPMLIYAIMLISLRQRPDFLMG